MSARQTSRTREFAGNIESKTSSTIAFVGLGAMGFGKASNLVKVGYQIMGFDVCAQGLQRQEEIEHNHL